jgi:hypothetical protein
MCKNLEVLRLSHNKLSGSIPYEIQNLVKLHEMEVNDNVLLMGNLSDNILSLPNLSQINLYGTDIKVDCSQICQDGNNRSRNVKNVSICLCN